MEYFCLKLVQYNEYALFSKHCWHWLNGSYSDALVLKHQGIRLRAGEFSAVYGLILTQDTIHVFVGNQDFVFNT